MAAYVVVAVDIHDPERYSLQGPRAASKEAQARDGELTHAAGGRAAARLEVLTMTEDGLPPFVPGLSLSERFFHAAVEPLLDQEEPWVGRCRDVGDELGSRIVATRLIVELMRLCFLIEREYWPYFKWFGTAFSRLRCAKALTSIFHEVFNTSDWKTREAVLGRAYLCVGAMHNELGLTEPVELRLAPFFGRPYQVPHAMRFVEALLGAIESPAVRALAPYVGAVDQFADSTDILDEVSKAQALTIVYDVGE